MSWEIPREVTIEEMVAAFRDRPDVLWSAMQKIKLAGPWEVWRPDGGREYKRRSPDGRVIVWAWEVEYTTYPDGTPASAVANFEWAYLIGGQPSSIRSCTSMGGALTRADAELVTLQYTLVGGLPDGV